MKRPQSDDDDGGLDSLLDTMTNVVGILVIVLVVTQLGVGDAVKRITEAIIVNEEQLNQKKQELTQLTAEQYQLNNQIVTLANVDVEAQKKELEDAEKRLNDRRRRAQNQEAEINKFALKLQADQKRADELKKAMEDTEKNREKLKVAIEESLERKATVEAKLDKTPKPQAAEAKVVTLPNPRPAPAGAKPIYFVCSGQEIFPIFIDPVRDEHRARAEAIVVAKRLFDPKKGIDPGVFLREYQRARSRRHDYFDVEMYVSGGRYPRLRFTPLKNQGASDAEVRNPRSRFRNLLQSIDPKKFYARFYVLPDSFDVYLSARAAAAEVGLLGGWEPQGEQWLLTTHLGGELRLGPPKPDPPAGPPAKPQNVID